MSFPNSEDWRGWNEERLRYREYDTQGFDADIEALEAHIRKLKEVAPKDKAGWPSGHALSVIDKLLVDLARGKAWQGKAT